MPQLIWYDLTKSGGLSAGAEHNFSPIETDAHTVMEIVGIQTDYEDGVVKVVVNGEEVPKLAINANLVKEGASFTADSGGSATSYLFKKYGFFMIGKPILFAQRFYGYPYEYTSIKVGPRSEWFIKLFGLSDTSNDIHVRVLVARAYDSELPRVFPGGFDFSFVVADPETGDTVHFTKSFPAINASNWTKLPGGLDQDEPKLFRFATYASGTSTTTANVPYQFDYPDFVQYTWQDMFWNLDDREAYIIDKAGFSGADYFRIYIETHKRNDWLTMPIMESTSGTDADIIEPFVTDIPPVLIHNTKGGLEVKSTSGGTTPVGALCGYYLKLR